VPALRACARRGCRNSYDSRSASEHCTAMSSTADIGQMVHRMTDSGRKQTSQRHVGRVARTKQNGFCTPCALNVYGASQALHDSLLDFRVRGNDGQARQAAPRAPAISTAPRRRACSRTEELAIPAKPVPAKPGGGDPVKKLPLNKIGQKRGGRLVIKLSHYRYRSTADLQSLRNPHT
jgi:hypothetical protein